MDRARLRHCQLATVGLRLTLTEDLQTQLVVSENGTCQPWAGAQLVEQTQNFVLTNSKLRLPQKDYPTDQSAQ